LVFLNQALFFLVNFAILSLTYFQGGRIMGNGEIIRRQYIFVGVIVMVFLLLIGRMVYLQLIQGRQYKMIAEENRIRMVPAIAPRGTIYDRNGAALVANRPSFAVSVIPSELINAEQVLPLLSALINMPEGEIRKLLDEGADDPFTPVRLKRNIDQTTLAKVEERRRELPGVLIEAVPLREYIYKDLAGQVFGYIGAMNEEELSELRKYGYRPSDLVGKTGLEKVWERTLKGQDGGRQIEVNAAGEPVRLVGDKTAIPGNGLVLTLDMNLQKAAQDALKEYIVWAQKGGRPVTSGGAIVVIDPRSGAIRAMVSEPGYDPNVFAGGVSLKDWQAIINNPHNPLLNRAIESTYPPASVFKIVTSAAALELGCATPGEIFKDTGVYVLNGWKFYGWKVEGLGPLDMSGALAWSSDPYFYEMGNRIGVDRLADYAVAFGFGKPTGINLPGEAQGIVPTAAWKEETHGEVWHPGETLIAAIGQGYYLVTPIQQANMIAAVANGGILFRPMLVDKVISPQGAVLEDLKPEALYTVGLSQDTWANIRKGLRAVVEQGTASGVFQGFPISVAGKTGTGETGAGTTHAWFACYAPYENPEAVVVVFIENGGEGSGAAAPLARKVLEAYFGLQPSARQKTPAPTGVGD
jgi:penicillin-binding protein 2